MEQLDLQSVELSTTDGQIQNTKFFADSWESSAHKNGTNSNSKEQSSTELVFDKSYKESSHLPSCEILEAESLGKFDFSNLKELDSEKVGEKKTDSSLDKLAESLPEHPVSNVLKEMAGAIISGDLDQVKMAKLMKEYTQAIEEGNPHGLPEMTEDDYVVGNHSDYFNRIYLGIHEFQRAIRENFNMNINLTENGIVFSGPMNSQGDAVNIGIGNDGTMGGFIGRYGHRVKGSISVDEALNQIFKK